ncbi:MAG TPA: branched-chain amino acid ABC transporter permease [Thermoanaerobacterales bacterium]|nr:branched-chain amino acid ABC transporter permease [Thermoanaerobacterales bacterium]
MVAYITYLKKQPLAAAFILLCILFPFVTSNQYLVRVLTEVFFFAALGNAWNIIGGYGRQTSWASATFFSVGAYTGIILYTRYGEISPWISVFIGMGLSVILAIIIGKPCFRLRGVYFAIATIACATIFRQALIYFEDFTGGSLGIAFKIRKEVSLWKLSFHSEIPFYFIAFIWMIITLLIVAYIERHRLGYYLRAICEDQEAAESLGINSSVVKLQAFIISCMMMAFTGTLYVFKTGYADPNTLASHDMSIRIGLVAILGGMGTVWGPTLGALITVPLLELSNAYLQNFGGGAAGWAVYGLLIVIMVLYKPNGIIHIAEDVRNYVRKKKFEGKRGENAAT